MLKKEQVSHFHAVHYGLTEQIVIQRGPFHGCWCSYVYN